MEHLLANKGGVGEMNQDTASESWTLTVVVIWPVMMYDSPAQVYDGEKKKKEGQLSFWYAKPEQR